MDPYQAGFLQLFTSCLTQTFTRTNKGELKAFATVTLVMGIFVLCWAPQIVLTMVGVFTGQPTSDPLQTLQVSKLVRKGEGFLCTSNNINSGEFR